MKVCIRTSFLFTVINYTPYPSGTPWITNFTVSEESTRLFRIEAHTDVCGVAKIPTFKINGWTEQSGSDDGSTFSDNDGSNKINITMLNTGQSGVTGSFALVYTNSENKTFQSEGKCLE